MMKMLDLFANSIFFQTFGSGFMKGFKKFQQLGMWAYFLALLPYFLIMICFQGSYNNATAIEKVLLIALLIMVLFLLTFDITAVACFFENPDKSEYFLATGVTRKEILNDKGLLGEFNAYVLSQKLKVPHKTLFNVCVPMPNGNYQEVDAIIITNNWLYVIECKNKSGVFTGDFEDENWVQSIGSKQHSVHNVYLQNQDHITAIEYYLKSKGVIPCVDIYSHNIMLTNGELRLNATNGRVPIDFAFGDVSFIRKQIEKEEKGNENRGENFMEEVYMALLPYALNSKDKRDSMQATRENLSRNGEFKKGEYRYYYFPDGIAGITKEETVLRKNMVFTQISVTDSETSFPIWITTANLEYTER